MPRLNATDSARREAEGHGSTYVEALARGLEVLLAFGRDRTALSLSDVARVTGLAKPTVRRMLLTLCELGYAETDSRLFRLTPRVLNLAVAYLGSDLVTTVLQPACERVLAETDEACFAAVLDDQEIVMIANATRRFPLGLVTSVGLRLPAVATAAGRVILGMLSDDDLNDHLKRAATQGPTEYTITDKAQLRSIILQGRVDGYCITRREATLDHCAVAVPLRRADGRAVGSLSIAARSDRYAANPKLLDALLDVLRRAAGALEHLLV